MRTTMTSACDSSPLDHRPSRRLLRRLAGAGLAGALLLTTAIGLTGCNGGDGNDKSESSAELPPSGEVAPTVPPTPSTTSPVARPATTPTTAPRTARVRPTITVEPATVHAGEQEVRVHGRNWGRRITVNIRLVDRGPPRGEFINFDVTTDGQGGFLGRFIVPSGVAPGDYIVEALGPPGSGSANAPLKVSRP